MNTQQLINRLKQQVIQLEQEALRHDQQLAPTQSKLLQDIERFNQSLFIQKGAQLSPCIVQIKKDIKQLEKQLSLRLGMATVAYRCQNIQDKFTALKRALTTTGVNLQAEQQKRASNRARYAKKQVKQHSHSGFEWIASSVMQNSHEIYQELNKHLNWAKKIEHKIAQMELSLNQCHPTEKIKLQNDILLMHKRLGKCRQAISYIEERIQYFERPHNKFNR
ncbi:primosomal replication protein [Shewanella intestini]|uniref:Prepilin peptidase n=1 Tax=Shewanella intestini TaxID=2017544 RepID=A0ABS5I6B2_9GAMM|nr:MULTISPECIES: primosomal replication protein [Shewanella]MBR9729556.1 prepilin peptidase [Shewanella intestini]MRG35448.1 prepilin peptidase [Shewanella sp. XMDDZSB0408]